MSARRLFVPMILLISVFGCKKAEKVNSGTFLPSNWTATDYWVGIGAADDGWHHIFSDSLQLSFDGKGKGVASINHVQQKGYYYQVTGDSTMDMKGDAVSGTGHSYYYLHNDTLEIWGIGCIEGCGARYARIHAID